MLVDDAVQAQHAAWVLERLVDPKAIHSFQITASKRRVHRRAALETLRECGLPMVVTAIAVSLGFLILVFSQFLGLANFGILVGVSLLTAMVADLFRSPLLLMLLRPKLS
jgi:predicted RND superfamily exporter protein